MTKIREGVAGAGFLLIFPGFFFWHLLLALGLNPINIGLFSHVSIALSVLAPILLSPILIPVNGRSAFAFLVSTLIVYCMCFTLTQWALGAHPAAVSQSLQTVSSWVALLFVGVFLPVTRGRLSGLIFLLWIAMGITVVAMAEGLSFNAREFSISNADVASYQGFARSYVVTCMVLLAVISRFLRRVIFAVPALAITFMLLSRSDFFGLIAAWLALEGFLLHRSRRFTFGALLVLAVSVMGAGILVMIFASQFIDARHFQILDLAESSSWQARMEFLARATVQVTASPLSGDFSGLANMEAMPEHAHNALTAWVSYGLVGFVLYVGACFGALVASVRGLARSDTQGWRLALMLSCFSLLLVIVAKGVTWPVPALAWGVVISQSGALRSTARLAFHHPPANTTTPSISQ